MAKRCGKCGKLKDESEFYRDKSKTDGLALECKECMKERVKRWRARHRERNNRVQKKWQRKYRVRSKSGGFGGRKRRRPKEGRCELCGRDCDAEKKLLSYHHWDDENLMKGIWVCYKYHGLIEIGEQAYELLARWYKMKEEIEMSCMLITQKELGL